MQEREDAIQGVLKDKCMNESTGANAALKFGLCEKTVQDIWDQLTKRKKLHAKRITKTLRVYFSIIKVSIKQCLATNPPKASKARLVGFS